jgi:hypothetical protein
MNKQIKLTVIAVTIALSALMSACGDASKVWNSCSEITTCVKNTPATYQAEYNSALQSANDALLNVLK